MVSVGQGGDTTGMLKVLVKLLISERAELVFPS